MVKRRARLIYNPTAGREEAKKRLADILMVLEQGGLETSCHATTGEGDATLAAAEAVANDFDVVIAAGGDGTIHEVVNGLADAKREDRPALGILPLGTTNDLARALHIPRQWDKAADLIVQGETMLIDVGQLNDTYFINIAGGGSMTELTYEVPSRMKSVLGQLAYYMKGVEKLPSLRPIQLHIQSEQHGFEGEAMLFLVSNSNSVGGFERLAPNTRLDDGYFKVIVLKRCNLAEFIRIVTLALRGEHLEDKNIVYFKAKSLKITSPDYTQLNLDGEFGGTLPCQISILPSHLRIFASDSRSLTSDDTEG